MWCRIVVLILTLLELCLSIEDDVQTPQWQDLECQNLRNKVTNKEKYFNEKKIQSSKIVGTSMQYKPARGTY